MEFAFLGPQSPDAWREWTGSNHEVTDEGVSIQRMPTPTFISPEPVIADLPGETTIVDLDLDECGALYLLTSDGSVYTYDPGTDRLTHRPCTWYERGDQDDDRATDDGSDASIDPSVVDDRTVDPQAIAVTSDSLYLADGDGGRVHCLSRQLLQTRWIASAPFETPVGLETVDGTVHVLDRGNGSGEGFVAVLADRGTATRTITGLKAPTELVIDADRNRYVLDGRDQSTDGPLAVRKFDDTHEELVDDAYPIEAFTVRGTSTTFEPSCIEVGEEDELLAGMDPEGSVERTLFRFARDERAFDRIPTFKRGAAALQLDRTAGTTGNRGLFVVDETARAVSFLEEVRHYRRNPATDRYDTQVRTRLDSGEPETAWHRATMEFDARSAGSQVQLRYYATDDDMASEDLADIPGIGPTYTGRLRDANVRWVSELLDLTAAEIHDITGAPLSTTSDWLTAAERRSVDWKSVTLPNPGDALLHDAVGRYLWVELSILGTESRTPRVESFRAYFPRQSYLRHLPEIYREDRDSAAFLERYLSIFESVFTDIEESIEGSTRNLDPRGISSEYLPWLRRWLALEAGETWSDEAERQLVERAPELFKKRGTPEGILEVIRLYLADPEADPDAASDSWERARRQERAVRRRLVEQGHLTDDEADAERLAYERLPEVYTQDQRLYLMEYTAFDCIDDEDVLSIYRPLLRCPQCFLVMVRPQIRDEQLRTIRQIVDDEQPAHAAGRAIELTPWIRLGSNAYLGINSTLPNRDAVLEESELGANAVLSERESGFQLGRRSRLDDDTPVS